MLYGYMASVISINAFYPHHASSCTRLGTIAECGFDDDLRYLLAVKAVFQLRNFKRIILGGSFIVFGMMIPRLREENLLQFAEKADSYD